VQTSVGRDFKMTKNIQNGFDRFFKTKSIIGFDLDFPTLVYESSQ
jgi:hypothetical protein